MQQWLGQALLEDEVVTNREQGKEPDKLNKEVRGASAWLMHTLVE